MNDANVLSCAAMIDVCSSYAAVKEDFMSSMHAIPLKQVKSEASRLKRTEEARSATQRTGESHNQNVDGVATSEDLCAILVTLITNARASANDQEASMNTAAIMCALEEFNWEKLKKGKIDILECYTKQD